MLRRIGSSFAAVAAISFGIAIAAMPLSAQDMAKPSSGAPAVTGKATGERIRFTAPSTVVQMKVEIVSEAGVPVFDVTSRGSVFDWAMKGGDGETVADGNYVCVITLKSVGGKLSQRVGTISFAGGRATMRPEARLTPGQEGTVGPIEEGSTIAVLGSDVPSTTVVGHDGKAGQVTATTGDLTFRTGDVFSGTETERMRVTADGRIGIGTDHPETTLDVRGTLRSSGGYEFTNGSKLTVDDNGTLKVTRANGTESPTVAGTGTQNRVAKWLETGGAGTLGDTLIFENLGSVGINTTTPGTLNGVTFSTVPLQLFRSNNSSYFAVDASGAGSFAGLVLNRSSATAGNRLWVIDNAPDPTNTSSVLGFSTYSDAGIPTPRMVLLRNGSVGVATTTPTYKFDISSDNVQALRVKGAPGAAFTTLDVDSIAGAQPAIRLAENGSNKYGMLYDPASTNWQFFQFGGGNKMTITPGTTGAIQQPLSNTGLVKAGVAVAGSATPTITRQFNNLPSGATITVTNIGTGTYNVDFGDDISGRFYSATNATGGISGATGGEIAISPRAGNPNALFIVTRDSTGATSNAVSFMVMIY